LLLIGTAAQCRKAEDWYWRVRHITAPFNNRKLEVRVEECRMRAKADHVEQVVALGATASDR